MKVIFIFLLLFPVFYKMDDYIELGNFRIIAEDVNKTHKYKIKVNNVEYSIAPSSVDYYDLNNGLKTSQILLSLINEYRVQNGLKALKWSKNVAEAASYQAEYLCEEFFYQYHHPFRPSCDSSQPFYNKLRDRFLKASRGRIVQPAMYEENLLFYWGRTLAPDKLAMMAFDGWKNSKMGHNETMLSEEGEYAGIITYHIRWTWKINNQDYIFSKTVVVLNIFSGNHQEMFKDEAIVINPKFTGYLRAHTSTITKKTENIQEPTKKVIPKILYNSKSKVSL